MQFFWRDYKIKGFDNLKVDNFILIIKPNSNEWEENKKRVNPNFYWFPEFK